MKLYKVKAFLGRGKKPSYYRVGQFSSKAYGRHDRKEPVISGRTLFDMLPIVRRGYKLRSYKLEAVAAHFLDLHKVVRLVEFDLCLVFAIKVVPVVTSPASPLGNKALAGLVVQEWLVLGEDSQTVEVGSDHVHIATLTFFGLNAC